MSAQVNRRIVLVARPEGNPKEGDFIIAKEPVPVPDEGQVLVKNTLLSLDPFNRILMGNANSDQQPIDLGDMMFGFTVGVVEQSANTEFPVGSHVAGFLGTLGWQDYALSDGSDIRLVDPRSVSLDAYLGVLGVTGLTAWVGLSRILNPKPRGTLVVTGAAGAVGSAAAQIGRLRGYRVVGIAGGPEKSHYLTSELGLDVAVDYKAPNFKELIGAAVPDGIDALYDNVGASLFSTLLPLMNNNAQIVIGGVMSQITETAPADGPDKLPDLLRATMYKSLTVRGFNVTEFYDLYPVFLEELTSLVADGTIRSTTHFIDGLENIPSVFPDMFTGRGPGKMVARIN